ncbi:MAG: cupin domain-containing protein [Sphingomonadales bacterium]|nr:cupin domain-containing protein [Sphingomonadales bacterium]
MSVFDLAKYPLHLGLGTKAEIQPEFTGAMQWYQEYSDRYDDRDGAAGRLVSLHHFTENWDSWEMHPNGDEVVLCLSGVMTLHQEIVSGTAAIVTLHPGEYAVNSPGCWHTADIAGRASALFITAGMGTQNRPR